MENSQPSSPDTRPCPETHLTRAILITIFCCLPFGIASIVHASRVSSLYAIGNYTEAVKESEKAEKWANIGMIVGIIYGILYFILVLAGVISEL